MENYMKKQLILDNATIVDYVTFTSGKFIHGDSNYIVINSPETVRESNVYWVQGGIISPEIIEEMRDSLFFLDLE